MKNIFAAFCILIASSAAFADDVSPNCKVINISVHKNGNATTYLRTYAKAYCSASDIRGLMSFEVWKYGAEKISVIFNSDTAQISVTFEDQKNEDSWYR